MSGALTVAVDARSLLCAQPRGEGKSLLRLYEEIVRQRPGVQPVFFGDARAAAFTGRLPAGTRRAGSARFGDRWNLWEDVYFPIAARRAGCQLMHCTSSGAPLLAGLPMVMTVHDLIPLRFDDGQDAAARRLFRRRLWHGLRQAGRVIAVSSHTRADLLLSFPGFRGRVDTVHWGAEPLRPAAGIAANPPYVLAFGGEARRKNTEYTLDRFVAAARRVPSLRLQLVGIASERQRHMLERRAAEAGMADRIHMPGFVSESELDALLERATALLYLSLYEGFGVPVAEAVSHGVPVIASNRTSVAELLAGVPGSFDLETPTAIEDAIVSLATDSTRRRAHACAQSTMLPRLKWSDTAARTIEAFEAVLAPEPPRGNVQGDTHLANGPREAP